MGRACVKTRLGEGCAALFSQLPSSERSCQYNRLPHRRNRDRSSTRKLDIGVFTQPRSKTEVPGFARHVRFTRRSRHRQAAPACPFGLELGHCSTQSACLKRAKFGSRRSHSITSSARSKKASGIVMPSAFAAVRLTTSSKVVGCSTGRSAGFAPFKILSTRSAACRNRSVVLAP
jgi:hypothetical protein